MDLCALGAGKLHLCRAGAAQLTLNQTMDGGRETLDLDGDALGLRTQATFDVVQRGLDARRAFPVDVHLHAA
jgi:hypothetical protein